MAIANTQSLKTSLNVDPYYDDFNEGKNFYRLLFRPGLAVQARELTQMQTMLQNQVDRFAEHVFKEGSVVRGVDLNYDEDVPFVRIRDNQSNGATANLTLLNSTEITGGTSGVKAIVVGTKFGSEANTPGTKTLYVQYTDSGTSKENTTFTLGETLTANNGQTANVISSAAFGTGSRVTLGEGIIYAKDHFIKVPESSIIVGEYNSNTANFKVGFNLTESITTSNNDTTLLDPAQGAYNYTAPGANRLTITPTIKKYALTETATTDFVEILRIKNGFLTMLGNEPQYNILGDAMANRTFEESGDYIVTGNRIRVREHLKSGNNNGVFTSALGGNNDLLSVDIGPGLSYVRGYRIDNKEVQHVAVRKGIDTITKEDELVAANYGNYVTVREVSGAWDINGHDRVNLYDTKQFAVSNNGTSNTSFNGTSLGTARVRGIEYSSGTKGTPGALYKIYLYDIKMTANTFNNIRSIGHTAAIGAYGKADTVLSNSNTVLSDSSFSRAIFNLPSRYIKTIRDGSNVNDTDYTFYKAETVTIANNGQFTVSTASDETFPTGTGTLSSTQRQNNFYLTFTDTANTAALTGTIGFSAGGNTITGTSTSFDTEINVGDKIKINSSQYANSFTVTEVTSASSLKTLEDANLTKSSQNYFKEFPAGTVVNLSGVGGDGASRSVVVGSSTSATFDIQEPLISSASARLHYKLRKANGVEKSKTYKFRRLVHLRLANNATTTTGPWDLGFADVHKIRFIRKNSSAFTAATDGKDVTDQFIFDNGQRDSLYEHGKISLIPTSTLTLTSSDYLLVCFDYFEHDTSSGTGYFSVDSYPIDDSNNLSNTAITTQEIPVYESQVTGVEYDLRGSLDARPKIENTATDTTAIGSMTINPPASTSVLESSGGLHFPAAATNYDLDLQIYLGRRDFIVLDRYGAGRNIEGLALEKLIDPTTARTDTMLMAKLDIAPYPSLPSRRAREAGRSDLANKLELVGNRRYTMRDIGVLENRVRVLEYYTAISLLEGRAKDFDKKDATGLTRFKNGFFVDNFTGHGKSDIFNNDYEAAIDRGLRELRPGKTTVNLEIDFAQANSSNVTARSKEIVVELASDVAFQDGETVTIGSATGKIKHIVGLEDRTGTYDTENFGNAKKLYIEEYTGTTALIHGATITGSSSGVSTTIVIDDSAGADNEPLGDAHFNKRLMQRLGIPFNSGKPGLGLRPIGRLITFPYTSEELINQPHATDSRNALGLAYKYVGNMALDPAVSMWNDRTKGPDISINYDGNLEAWAALTGEILPRIAGRCWNKIWGDWVADGGGGGGRWVRRDGEELTFIPGNEISTEFEVVTDVTILPFIKAQTIHAQAYGLKPNTRHYPYFDGVDVSPFCQLVTKAVGEGTGEASEYSNTSNLGSPLFTDANGAITLAFNLPSDEQNQFTSGDRIPFTLTDSSTNSKELGQVTSSATAEFAGSGLDTTISKGEFSVTPIEVTRTAIFERRFIPAPRRDPLAQSFFVRKETFSGELKEQELESVGAFLTKADLYFETKDDTLPVNVDIRAMDEETGQPTQNVIPNSKVTLQPYEINVSPNGLVPTTVFFDTPVFLLSGRQYCIVIRPDPRNTNCRVFTARLGENDLLTENRVTSQPHSGILFTSSNEFTWRHQQEEDLKMRLYFAKFDTSQTGTAVLKNRGYEFLKVSNTSTQFTDFGEKINGETVVTLTSTSYSNSASLAGAFVQGATSGAVGKFASQNTAANTINISDVGTTQFANGEFIRFRTGNANTGTIVGNTAVSIGMSTANGVLYYYDDFSRANNNILYLDKSSGNFKAGMKVKGVRSGYTAQIDSITDSPIDAIYLHNSQMALPGCSISAKGKFAATSSTRDSDFTKLNSQAVTEGLINRRLCLSSSNETTNLSGQKSLEVVYTMQNSVDSRLSPAIDMRLGNILLIENFLNNVTTNEEGTAGGDAQARHLTKTVQLADGQDAEDIVVVLDAYKPQGTGVHVYYKILHADDSDTMRDVSWVKMDQDTEANLYSSSENTEDFKEYEFSIPSAKQTGHNGTVEYTNSEGVTFAGFKNFKIKIVFTGSNTSLPPRVRDLRVIALQR